MVFRLDIGSNLRPVKYLADGAARVDATLTRTGVFTYLDASGKPTREYRPESEVFDADSVESFEGVPVTDDHPPTMVTADNAATYRRGRVSGSVRKDGTHMVGSLVIDDASLIAKMKSGKRQVSNGYTCDLEQTPGVSPEGEEYDCIQRKIRGNHVAIVDVGRAGTARVRMDGAAIQISPEDAPTVSDSIRRFDQEISAMEELQKKLGEALAAIEAEKARADKAEAARDAEKVRADQATVRADQADAARDAAAVRADAADKARTDATANVPALVTERVALVSAATLVLGSEFKLDGKSLLECDPRAIKCAIVKHVDGTDVAADRSDAYVDGRYDAAIARADKATAATSKVRTAVVASATAPAPAAKTESKESIARRKMHEDSRQAYLAKEGI